MLDQVLSQADANTIVELEAEIKVLEGQIKERQDKLSEIKNREENAHLALVKQVMGKYGFTAEQIGLKIQTQQKEAKPRKAGDGVSQTRNPAPIKYRGPNGETWSGRGLSPRWLTALTNAGHDKEEYRIKDAA